MRAELEAIKAVLAGVGAAHVGDVPPNTLPPYTAVGPAPEASGREVPLDALEHGEVNFAARIKSVQGTEAGALTLASNNKAILSPDGAATIIRTATRRIEISYGRQEAVYTDESITLPSTNRSPGVVVETYTVNSQPL